MIQLVTILLDLHHHHLNMPVTTRSMMKRGLQPTPGSVGLLTCPTCCTDGDPIILCNTPLAQPPTSNQSVPELIDQCEASISSSESDTSSLLSSEDESEISKFQNICLYTSSLLLS
jgi:hypothetical protein